MSVRLRLSLVLGLLIVMLVGLVYVGVNALNAQVQDSDEINHITVVRSLSTRIDFLAQQVVDQDLQVGQIQERLNDSVVSSGQLALALRQFFAASSENVTRTEFDEFLDDIRRDYPTVRTGQYATRVTAFERGQFETALQTEGFSGFRIKEPDRSGQLITATQRTDYFPINYIAPFEDNEGIFGYDLGATTAVLSALNQARDNNEVVATAPLQLLPSRGQTFMLVVPVYRNNVDISSLDTRRSALTGFVVLEMEIPRLIDQTAAVSGNGYAVATINDVTTVETPLTVFDRSVSTQAATTTFPLTVFGRQWNIVTTTKLDSAVLIADMTTAVADIQDRVADLQTDVNGGLSRHTTLDIIPTYNELVNITNTMSVDANRFITADSARLREDLLANVVFQADRLNSQTATLIDLLIDEQTDQIANTSDIAILVAIAAGLVTVAGVYTLLQVVRRLNNVNRVAGKLSQGNLSTRVDYPGNDEIGQIGQALNVMASELESVIGSLEERINNRTRELQTVADVNTQISTILDPTRLLQDVADLTKERFRLYHSHIYRYDEASTLLVLTAGAGHVGRQMVSEGRAISLDNQLSIVATAAVTRQGVIINNVTQSDTFLPNPLLPDTRSELAVPLIARGQLLGVLDVQSDHVGFFTDEMLAVIELLAGQVATALSNAQLYEVAERTSRHERALGAIDRRIQNAVDVDDMLQTAVRELGKALRVPYTAIELQLNEDDEETQPLTNGHQQ